MVVCGADHDLSASDASEPRETDLRRASRVFHLSETGSTPCGVQRRGIPPPPDVGAISLPVKRFSAIRSPRPVGNAQQHREGSQVDTIGAQTVEGEGLTRLSANNRPGEPER